MAVHAPNPNAVLNARRVIAAARDIRRTPPPSRRQSPALCACTPKCATARAHWVVEEETADILDGVLRGFPLPDAPFLASGER